MSNEVDSARKREIVFWAAVLTIVVLTVLAAILVWNHSDTGDLVRSPNDAEGLRDSVKIMLDCFSELVTLITASFGGVAFLISLQKDRTEILSSRAWIALGVGVVLLALALLLAFTGREQLLLMSTHNAVNLSSPALGLIRWFCYLCIILSGILISSFMIEVAVTPVKPRDKSPVCWPWI